MVLKLEGHAQGASRGLVRCWVHQAHRLSREVETHDVLHQDRRSDEAGEVLAIRIADWGDRRTLCTPYPAPKREGHAIHEPRRHGGLSSAMPVKIAAVRHASLAGQLPIYHLNRRDGANPLDGHRFSCRPRSAGCKGESYRSVIHLGALCGQPPTPSAQAAPERLPSKYPRKDPLDSSPLRPVEPVA